jgi:hypothetical protein
VVDAVDEVLNRIEQQKEEPQLPGGIMALPLLQMAYRGQVKLTPQQARCAIEALPYETPKLSAVAHGHFEGNDFASALDRAIERSGINAKPLPPPKVIDHEPPVSPEEMKRPFTRLRRF